MQGAVALGEKVWSQGSGGIRCQMRGGTKVRVLGQEGMQGGSTEGGDQVKGGVQVDPNVCLPAPRI